MSMDYAQMEIDRLTDLAHREQHAELYGPEFYDFTPVLCERPNTQCLSFRLVYTEETTADLRQSLEDALEHHGCVLERATPSVLDGALSCSAVSQQGRVAIRKIRALLRRWAAHGRLTYVDAYECLPKAGPRRRKR